MTLPPQSSYRLEYAIADHANNRRAPETYKRGSNPAVSTRGVSKAGADLLSRPSNHHGQTLAFLTAPDAAHPTHAQRPHTAATE